MSQLLNNFKIDTGRDKLAVDVQFYQAGLQSIVEQAMLFYPELDLDVLPSWSKVAAAPQKAKGFIIYMLQAIFTGQHNAEDLHMNVQFEDAGQGERVAMMFMSIDNAQLQLVGEYAEEALPGWIVQIINGDVTKGKDAERLANNTIDQARLENKAAKVLFIACNMAQRSFSVKEITELYLAYDGGQQGATIQKMSRALTPSTRHNKLSKIVSLSFDPNRDDKLDDVLIETALNYQANHNIRSLREALRDVLRTIDVFQCTLDGSVKLDVDTYMAILLKNDRLSRVIGQMVDMSDLDEEMIAALASGRAPNWNDGRVNPTTKGKTRKIPKPKKRSDSEVDEARKMRLQVRKVIMGFVENVHILVTSTKAKTIHEALKIIEQSKEYQEAIPVMYGIDYNLATYLIKHVVNMKLLQLLLDK